CSKANSLRIARVPGVLSHATLLRRGFGVEWRKKRSGPFCGAHNRRLAARTHMRVATHGRALMPVQGLPLLSTLVPKSLHNAYHVHSYFNVEKVWDEWVHFCDPWSERLRRYCATSGASSCGYFSACDWRSAGRSRPGSRVNVPAPAPARRSPL